MILSLWENLKQMSSDALIKTLLDVLAGLLILVIGFVLIKWLMKLFRRSRFLKKVDLGMVKFTESMLSVTLKILLIITVAAVIGVPSASIIALLGSAGLAVGLALQGSLSNFAGGLMLMIFKPFKIGDFIDTADFSAGVVTDINVFYTTLRTYDNRILVIPNGNLSNKSIVNFSSEKQRRVDLEFGVSYDTPVDFVKNVISETAHENKYVLEEPDIAVVLERFADSAMIFTLRVWCENADYWNCKYSLNEEVKKAFDKNGIVIPFPQIDVHTDKK